MSRSKDKGTWAETAVTEYAGHSGFPYADRLTLKGSNDRGDVGWCPGVICEVKNDKSFDLSGWLQETAVEKANANAEHAFLVVKPDGVGRTRVGMWWSVMYSRDWQALCLAAGWRSELPTSYMRLSGAKYKKPLAALALTPFRGVVEINPAGVKNDLDWYIVTRLEQQVSLLHTAGYGTPEVLGVAAGPQHAG